MRKRSHNNQDESTVYLELSQCARIGIRGATVVIEYYEDGTAWGVAGEFPAGKVIDFLKRNF